MTDLPPPLAVDSERRILGAVIMGELATGDLNRLRLSCFGVDAHRWLFLRLRDVLAVPTDAGRLAKIRELWRAYPENALDSRVADDLCALPWQPVRSPEEHTADVDLLIELAKRRGLIERIQRADVAMRLGIMSSREALDFIRTGVGEPDLF